MKEEGVCMKRKKRACMRRNVEVVTCEGRGSMHEKEEGSIYVCERRGSLYCIRRKEEDGSICVKEEGTFTVLFKKEEGRREHVQRDMNGEEEESVNGKEE